MRGIAKEATVTNLVVVIGAIRTDKHFIIIVAEDDGLVFGVVCPNLWHSRKQAKDLKKVVDQPPSYSSSQTDR